MPSYDRARHALRAWLDSWSGIGHVAVGMRRQGFDLQLTQYDERGWRATFYTAARCRRAADFLWFMSSDFSLMLPQLLARHRGQMVLLVIRDLAFPHDEDDLQPFCAQRSQRLAVRVSPLSLLVVVRAGPLTREQ